MDKIEVIKALRALAQESRMDIFRLLVEKGSTGMMMGGIGESLNLPHATLSFHLDKLRQAGLISYTRMGRSVIYAVNYESLVESIRYLTETCCKDSDLSCRIVIKEDKPCHQ